MSSKELKHHRRAIYIDIESSFWAGPPPPGLAHSIIEIAFVEMDLQTLTITREKAHFVRPTRWDISDRCTRFTGITSGDIRTACPFPEVITSLTTQFAPSDALCCTWGNDAVPIAATCHEHGLRMPLRNLLDLAQLFQGLFLLKQAASLRAAVSMLGLEFEGIPHGALPDARNTALVHAAVLRRMRRQPDLLPAVAEGSTQPPGLTLFGEKLRDALQGG